MSTKLAKVEELPEYLRGQSGVPMEGIGQEDIATPLLLLLQALSPQVEDGLGKAGEFFHSGAEVALGSSIYITPLFVTKAYTLWRPRPDGGILARSRDGISWDQTGSWEVKVKGTDRPVKWTIDTLDVKESGLAEWGSSNPADKDSKPAATLSYNIPVLIKDYWQLGPAVMQLQRSQIGPAKKLLGRFRVLSVPYYALSIPTDVFKDNGPEGVYYNYKFGKFNFITQEEFEYAQQMHDNFKSQGVKVRDLPTTPAEDDNEGDY